MIIKKYVGFLYFWYDSDLFGFLIVLVVVLGWFECRCVVLVGCCGFV